MGNKLSRLRFELNNGNWMLSKLTDMESGNVIPFCGFKLEWDVNGGADRYYVVATIRVPINQIEINGLDCEIETDS